MKRRKLQWVATDRKGMFDGGPTGLDCPYLWPSKYCKFEDGIWYKKVEVRPAESEDPTT